MTRLVLTASLLVSATVAYGLEPPLKGWQSEVRRIEVVSSLDHSAQPALTWSPPTSGPRPLLVGLHTWGGDYTQASNGRVYAQWCMDQGWHFVYPNFRGPNRTPAAMGSNLAVQDVVDAVEHLKKTQKVDASRIYLIGVSGGGHMAMLMAGRHPEIWAGVSAWCGISDIAAWHAEHLKGGKPDNYAANIESALGGAPEGTLLEDARKRSPLTYLARAKEVPLDLNHGIHDGRVGSVPFRHSLLAFNQSAAAAPLPEAEIASYYETQQRPASWPAPAEDALYTGMPLKAPTSARAASAPSTRTPVAKPVLFRQTSGSSRITLFDGGHEILYAPALNWLALQKKGQPVVWEIAKPIPLSKEADTQSGL